MGRDPALLAVSDLHVDHQENRLLVDLLRPGADGDWLIVGGDVAGSPADVEWALGLLSERFERVIWVPGNHELYALPRDGRELRGERRYTHLVERCRRLGVTTPEDPFPVWEGAGGPARIAPLFLLYDYTFGRGAGETREEALQRAFEAGVLCTDELLLHPDPYPSREDWCKARVEATDSLLAGAGADLPLVLVNHYPLVEEPTRILRHPEFAQWCGTVKTAHWHRRYRVAVVVYGHLHIPGTSWYDGTRFEEVSLGYPQERRRRREAFAPRQILPEVPRA